jgi:hypothetical protein
MRNKKEKEWAPHIVKEGARYHVISYHQDRGAVCSEPNCEVNKPFDKVRKPLERPPSVPYDGPEWMCCDGGECQNLDEDPAEFWARGEAWGD